jgi:hypothetical protein
MNRSNTFSTMAPANRIRLGGLALILAGVTLAPVGILMSRVKTAPTNNLKFAKGANSFSWRLGMALTGLSLALLMMGTFALYTHLSRTKQERLAFAGMLMTIGLVALMLPVTGFAAYVVPAIGKLVAQGHEEMIDVMDQTFKEPFLVIPFFGGILWHIGSVLLGIAIWRSKALWSWGGVLYITYGVLGIPAFLDMKALQIVAPLVGGAGQAAVGVSLWRVAAAGVRQTDEHLHSDPSHRLSFDDRPVEET